MHAFFEMPEGLKRLGEIVASFPPDSEHWNEAQNRFQFIDRLLTECLGWERPDIEVERTDETGGRADYILGHPAKAVLEAKREAKLWTLLPTGTPHKIRKMASLLHASKHFAEAVHQVIPYCSLRGAAIAIVQDRSFLPVMGLENEQPRRTGGNASSTSRTTCGINLRKVGCHSQGYIESLIQSCRNAARQPSHSICPATGFLNFSGCQ